MATMARVTTPSSTRYRLGDSKDVDERLAADAAVSEWCEPRSRTALGRVLMRSQRESGRRRKRSPDWSRRGRESLAGSRVLEVEGSATDFESAARACNLTGGEGS